MHIDKIERVCTLNQRRKYLLDEEKWLSSLIGTSPNVTIAGTFVGFKDGDLEDVIQIIIAARRRDRDTIEDEMTDLGVTL